MDQYLLVNAGVKTVDNFIYILRYVAFLLVRVRPRVGILDYFMCAWFRLRVQVQ